MFQKDLFGNSAEVQKKPFLRWTGGKNWLIKHLKTLISKIEFDTYHEPFIGGGSVFFSLETIKNSCLSDSNSELINTYKQVRDNPKGTIDYLKDFPQNKEFYYYLREKKTRSNIEKAAKFIFLNKTSFNGIYRVNSNGTYNVPYGKRSFDYKVLSKLIYSCSYQLKNSDISCIDFSESISKIKKNDLVYLDPPYTISHNDNGFILYNEKLFSFYDQQRLAEIIKKIRDKGAYYILSNAHHPDVKKIYHKFNDSILSLERKSMISGNNKGRDIYSEYLFTNIL